MVVLRVVVRLRVGHGGDNDNGVGKDIDSRNGVNDNAGVGKDDGSGGEGAGVV